MNKEATTSLLDYSPYPFEIPNIQLKFIISSHRVTVESFMKVVPKVDFSNSLMLKGSDVENTHDGVSVLDFFQRLKDFLY